MPSHRPERLAQAIREVVSTAILHEVSDPRVKGVTVLGAEVAPDLRNATVLVTVMGSESQQRLALRGLDSARGYLQSKLAERLQTRYTPRLTFKKDDGVKRSIEMSRIIDDVVAGDRRGRPESEDEPEPEGSERD